MGPIHGKEEEEPHQKMGCMLTYRNMFQDMEIIKWNNLTRKWGMC
jgi:hypothetical protein